LLPVLLFPAGPPVFFEAVAGVLLLLRDPRRLLDMAEGFFLDDVPAARA
jgi:hypothetical protein